jgi:lysozyme family protein
MNPLVDKIVGLNITPIEYVLQNEGGFTVDQGGPTNFGITLPVLASYKKVDPNTLTEMDIKNLTPTLAGQIYVSEFWNRYNIKMLKDINVGTCLLDTFINRGPGVGILYAQKVCNLLGQKISLDRILGSGTAFSINACDRKNFITCYEALEMAGYEAVLSAHPEYEAFRAGWTNRAKKLLTLAV